MELEKNCRGCVRHLKRLVGVIIVLIALCLGSCASKRPALKETVTEIVTVTELHRDTVIVTERDSAMMRALLECDSAGNVIMRQLDVAQGKLNAKVTDVKLWRPPGMPGNQWLLEASFVADSLRQEIALRDKIIDKSREHTIPVAVPRDLSWWQTTLMWVGVITLLIIVANIGYVIYTKKWIKR